VHITLYKNYPEMHQRSKLECHHYKVSRRHKRKYSWFVGKQNFLDYITKATNNHMEIEFQQNVFFPLQKILVRYNPVSICYSGYINNLCNSISRRQRVQLKMGKSLTSPRKDTLAPNKYMKMPICHCHLGNFKQLWDTTSTTIEGQNRSGNCIVV
jgi:hypothetical protein